MATIEQDRLVEKKVLPSDEALSAVQNGKMSRKFNPVLLSALVLTILLLVAGIPLWSHFSSLEETDNAYVEGHISTVSPRIAGTVTEVLVEEHQKVKRGQLLAVLDPSDQQAVLDEDAALLEQSKKDAQAALSRIRQTELSALGQTSQANGDISAVKADIARARFAVAEAADQLTEAQGRLKELRAQEEYARADFARYEKVYASRAVTKQQFEKARQNLQVAIAQKEQAEQNIAQCRKQKLQAETRVEEARARLDKSRGMLTSARSLNAQKLVDEAQYLGALASVKHHQASVDQAALQLSYTKILAPVDGRIGRKSVEVGQRVEPGQSLLSVVQDDVWIIANFKETQLGKMHEGQKVEIKIDTFPDKTFEGRLDSIGPASGAKFSMLPPDNATGNFTKIVQRIPVKILFDREGLGGYLKRIAPGMSCVVTVNLKQ